MSVGVGDDGQPAKSASEPARKKRFMGPWSHLSGAMARPQGAVIVSVVGAPAARRTPGIVTRPSASTVTVPD